MQKQANITDLKNPYDIEYENPSDCQNDRDRINYFDERHGFLSHIKNVLNLHRLTMPKDTQIFRGRSHEILFLNSHGLVLRIGPTQVNELINPALLQPIHSWPVYANITMTLHSGTQLYTDVVDSGADPVIDNRLAVFELKNRMLIWGNKADDVYPPNMGVIPVKASFKNKALLPIQIDIDNDGHEISDAKDYHLFKNFGLEQRTYQGTLPKNLRNIFLSVLENNFDANDESCTQKMQDTYLETFDYHQPLRRAFARAFKEVDPCAPLIEQEPDAKALVQAWTMAKNFHDHGYKILGKETDENGQKIGKRIVQQERRLYSPWTKNI